MLLLPLLLSSVPAEANTWHRYGKYELQGPIGLSYWIDVASIHTHKGITYYNGAFGPSDFPTKGRDVFYGAKVNCRARINDGGFYVRSREEYRKSGETKETEKNEFENRLFDLVCPEGTLSPDFDTAKEFM